MNEASGTSIFDKSGFGATLSVTNASGWGNGVALSGWTITASNSIAEAADNDLHDIGTGSFTAICWFNCGPQTALQGALMSKHISAQEVGRWYVDIGIITANAITFSVVTNATIGTIASTATLGGLSSLTNLTWNQVVGVVDRASASILIYTNGIVSNSKGIAWGSLNLNSTNRFRVGALGSTTGSQPNYCLVGSVDDARIYNRALSAQEIKLLYNGGRTSQR